MPNETLKDVSLCAIVRDEKMNPAGGIRRFVDLHVPYVERAVILDTGSKDGTMQILEELQGQYDNLEVYDRPFDNFANSRNYSLGLVKTRMALILDADERLTRQDFLGLDRKIHEEDKKGYVFNFLNVYPDGGEHDVGEGGHNPRLFELNLPRTRFNGRWEVLHFDDKPFMEHENLLARTGIYIKHFIPSAAARGNKHVDWYNRVQEGRFKFDHGDVEAPSDCSTFSTWKEYNPHEQKYV